MKGCEHLKNIDVRLEMTKAGLKQWQVADLIGISEQALSKKLRKELQEEEKNHIIEKIRNPLSNR